MCLQVVGGSHCAHHILNFCAHLPLFSVLQRTASLATPTPTPPSPDHRRCFCGNDLPAPGRGGWQPPSANHTGPWWCVHPLSSAPCNADCYRSNRTAPVTKLCCCPGNATQGCGSVGLLQVLSQLSTHHLCSTSAAAACCCLPAHRCCCCCTHVGVMATLPHAWGQRVRMLARLCHGFHR